MYPLSENIKEDLKNLFTFTKNSNLQDQDLSHRITSFVEVNEVLLLRERGDCEIQVMMDRLQKVLLTLEPTPVCEVFKRFRTQVPPLNRDVLSVMQTNLNPFEIAINRGISHLFNSASAPFVQIESINKAFGSFDQCGFTTGRQILHFFRGRDKTSLRHLDLTDIFLLPGEFESIVEDMCNLLTLKVCSDFINNFSLSRLKHLTHLIELAVESQEVSGTGAALALFYFPNLRSLRLKINLSEEDCHSLHPYLHRIEHLDLSNNYPHLQDIHISHLVSSMTRLQSLNLTGSVISGSCLQQIPSQHLRKLILNDCYDELTDEYLLPLLENFKPLVELSIDYCNLLTDSFLLGVAQMLENLESLDIFDCTFSEKGLAQAAPFFRNLRHFRMGRRNNLNGNFLLPLLESNPRLESLTLIEKNTANALLKVDPSKVPQLQKLKLSGADLNKNCAQLGTHLRTLVELDLFSCQVSDEFIEAIAPNLTGLKILSLRSCSGLTDRSLTALAPYLHHLEVLHLPQIGPFTDAAIRSLSQSLRRLTTLSLEGLVNLSDATLIDILGPLAGLRFLNLAGCVGLTDEFIIKMDKKFAFLTHLDLSSCKLSHESLIMLAGLLTNVKELVLSEVAYFDDRVIDNISSKRISRLDCSYNFVTVPALQRLINKGSLRKLEYGKNRMLSIVDKNYILPNCLNIN